MKIKKTGFEHIDNLIKVLDEDCGHVVSVRYYEADYPYHGAIFEVEVCSMFDHPVFVFDANTGKTIFEEGDC